LDTSAWLEPAVICRLVVIWLLMFGAETALSSRKMPSGRRLMLLPVSSPNRLPAAVSSMNATASRPAWVAIGVAPPRSFHEFRPVIEQAHVGRVVGQHVGLAQVLANDDSGFWAMLFSSGLVTSNQRK